MQTSDVNFIVPSSSSISRTFSKNTFLTKPNSFLLKLLYHVYVRYPRVRFECFLCRFVRRLTPSLTMMAPDRVRRALSIELVDVSNRPYLLCLKSPNYRLEHPQNPLFDPPIRQTTGSGSENDGSR